MQSAEWSASTTIGLRGDLSNVLRQIVDLESEIRRYHYRLFHVAGTSEDPAYLASLQSISKELHQQAKIMEQKMKVFSDPAP